LCDENDRLQDQILRLQKNLNEGLAMIVDKKYIQNNNMPIVLTIGILLWNILRVS